MYNTGARFTCVMYCRGESPNLSAGSLPIGIISIDLSGQSVSEQVLHGRDDPLTPLIMRTVQSSTSQDGGARLQSLPAVRSWASLLNTRYACRRLVQAAVTQLHAAAATGADGATLARYAEAGCDPNVAAASGSATGPLMDAVLLGNAAAAVVLLGAGANPNVTDASGTPLLAYALCALSARPALAAALQAEARKSQPASIEHSLMADELAAAECVRLLLKRGAFPRSRDARGNTLLHWLAGGNVLGKEPSDPSGSTPIRLLGVDAIVVRYKRITTSPITQSQTHRLLLQCSFGPASLRTHQRSVGTRSGLGCCQHGWPDSAACCVSIRATRCLKHLFLTIK